MQLDDFDGFRPFCEGRAWVNRGGARAFAPGECHSGWMRGAALGGAWGLIDDSGRVIIEPTYDGAMDFCEGRAWGNRGGQMRATHGWITYWCEGGRWALLDLDGRERLPASFTQVRPFTGGVAWARLEQWGLLDHEGRWLIPPRFDETLWRSREIPAFVGGVEPVALGGKWGLIDRSGGWVLAPTYDQIFDFHDGVAKVASWLDDPDPQDQVARSGLFGLIDTSGHLIKPLGPL